MILYTLIQKKSFEDVKLLMKYWILIIDGTGLAIEKQEDWQRRTCAWFV